MDNYDSHVTGVSFITLLTVVLIALKLLGKISLSWLWVLMPLIISSVATILASIFLIIGYKRNWF